MKTFIWNTEFMVHVAIAESIEEARDKVIEDYYKEHRGSEDTAMMIDDKIPSILPIFPYPKTFSEFINQQPPLILSKENPAINYNHANE